MKVLLTLFEIQDYGGIVGDVEYLIKGLRENGHECDIVLLRPNDRDLTLRKATGPKGSYDSTTGGEAHTLAGWYGIKVLGYVGDRAILNWQRFASRYDLVIHEIPNPPQDEKGYWKQIYDIDPPQLIAAHDAHFRDMYPYIREIAHRVKGISCTNHAGYNALSWFPGPRAFIGAAHVPREAAWDRDTPWEYRAKRAVCAHVWKAWKRMDKVVEAALHTKSKVVMGGDGIEGRYMRSKDKCKPKYIGLWDKFLASGGEYKGLMTHDELFLEYQNARVMVDMSYSRKFQALGNHFNRSVIEAYNNGCVPICTVENMAVTNEQVPLFSDKDNYIAVEHNIDPENLAEVIDWTMQLNPATVERVIQKGRRILLDHFDYRKVCLEYLKLAEGKPAGIYPILEVGSWPEKN